MPGEGGKWRCGRGTATVTRFIAKPTVVVGSPLRLVSAFPATARKTDIFIVAQRLSAGSAKSSRFSSSAQPSAAQARPDCQMTLIKAKQATGLNFS